MVMPMKIQTIKIFVAIFSMLASMSVWSLTSKCEAGPLVAHMNHKLAGNLVDDFIAFPQCNPPTDCQ